MQFNSRFTFVQNVLISNVEQTDQHEKKCEHVTPSEYVRKSRLIFHRWCAIIVKVNKPNVFTSALFLKEALEF